MVGELFKAILDVKDKAIHCKTYLECLKSTLKRVIPMIDEIKQLDEELLDRRRTDMDLLIQPLRDPNLKIGSESMIEQSIPEVILVVDEGAALELGFPLSRITVRTMGTDTSIVAGSARSVVQKKTLARVYNMLWKRIRVSKNGGRCRRIFPSSVWFFFFCAELRRLQSVREQICLMSVSPAIIRQELGIGALGVPAARKGDLEARASCFDCYSAVHGLLSTCLRPSRLVNMTCLKVMAYGGIILAVLLSALGLGEIRLCTCTGGSASTLELSRKGAATASCKTCGGKQLVDRRGSLSGSMLSTVGLELTSLINPDLTWKTVSKGNRSASRRARKPVIRSLKESRELVDKGPERVDEMPVSESEKLGVTILGCRFNDKIEHVPIKKRRFLFRSPSPPPRTPSPRTESERLIDSHPVAGQESYPDSIAKQKLMAIDAAVAMELGQFVDRKNSTEKIEKVGVGEDFSGISILAAVACNNSMGGDDGNVEEGSVTSVAEESSVREGFSEILVNKESCLVAKQLSKEHLLNSSAITNEGTDSCTSAMPVEETISSSGAANSSTKDLTYGYDMEGSFFPDNSVPVLQNRPSNKDDETLRKFESSLLDDRSHWDLNTVMDAWEHSGDVLTVESHTNFIDGISEDGMHEEKLGNLEGCEMQMEPGDTKYDIERTLPSVVERVVSGDVHGDVYGLADSRSLAFATHKSSREEYKLDACLGPDGTTCFEEKVLSSEIDNGQISVMGPAEETKPLHNQERINFVVESVVSSATVEHPLQPSTSAVAEEDAFIQCGSFCDTGNSEIISSHKVISMDPSPCLQSDHITSTWVSEENKNTVSTSAIAKPNRDDHAADGKFDETICLRAQAEKHDVALPHAAVSEKATHKIDGVIEDGEDADRTSDLHDDGNVPKKMMSMDTCQLQGYGCLDDVKENAVIKSDEMDTSESSPNCEELSASAASVGKCLSVEAADTKVLDGKVSVVDTAEVDDHPVHFDSEELSHKLELSAGAGKVGGENGLCIVGDAAEEATTESVSFRMKMSGWDQLPEGSRSFANKTLEVSDDSARRNCNGDRVDRIDAEDSMMRVVRSTTSKRELLSRIEGPTSSDASLGKDRVCLQGSRPNNLDDSNTKVERETRSAKLIGRGLSHMHGRGRGGDRWADPSEGHFGLKRYHSPTYHDSAGYGRPGPKNAATAVAAKVENSGLVVAPDGTIVKAAGSVGHNGNVRRQSVNSSSQGGHRSLMRRGSPTDRDEAFGMHMGIGQVGRMSPNRNLIFGRGRSGRYGPRVVGRGPRERYHGHVPDIAERSLHMPHPLARRERSFSPILRRGSPHLSRSHTKSPSRSGTRSPREWSSPRGRNRAGIGGGPGFRRCSGSPPNFKSEARMERRSPYRQSGFAADHIVGYMPRSRGSPQHTSRWINDRRDAVDHFRDHDSNQQSSYLDRRSPGRIHPRNHRFDLVDSRGSLDPDEYYRPRHLGRFTEMVGGGRGHRYEGSYDDRRKHGNRYGMMVRPVRRYDMDGPIKRFRYDVEDGFAAHNSHNKDGSEFHGSPKDYDSEIDSRLRDAPRRSREERGHFRYGRDGKHNASSKSFGMRECDDEEFAPRRRRPS
ncbi:hypothetical protein HHK36_028997 [Tetracentron sinense]|uniref:RPW8 domain-containing protein n=1 Tax=Tetracentron sinense TaxID=13715 RepID=A0A835D0Y9_TETSI|nr:hypothetical protein HHK36_028997 [Tetracentron sinense]